MEALEVAAGSLKTRAGKMVNTAGTGTATVGRDGGAQSQEGPEQMEFTFPSTENEKEQEATIKAVLSIMGSSVELRRLTVAIGRGQAMAKRAMEYPMKRYRRSKGGMEVIQLEDSYQVCTKSGYCGNLTRAAITPRKQVLTEVVLETLSIVAYKRPVTKMEIEKIRGVKSDHAVNRLVEYDLVYEIGRLDTLGRPALFVTTGEFLRRFGVGSVQDLLDINPEQEAEIEAQVEEELQSKLEETGLSALEEAAATEEE